MQPYQRLHLSNAVSVLRFTCFFYQLHYTHLKFFFFFKIGNEKRVSVYEWMSVFLFQVKICFSNLKYLSNLKYNRFESTKSTPGVLYNIGYTSETHLKLRPREISFAHNIRLNNPIVLQFWKEHASITAVLCSRRFKMIRQLRAMFWTNGISWDLSLIWVSDGYIILHITKGSARWSHN